MSLDDIGGVLRGLSSQVSVVHLTPEAEQRIRELVRELQEILGDSAKRTA
jgi:hypothetical protein